MIDQLQIRILSDWRWLRAHYVALFLFAPIAITPGLVAYQLQTTQVLQRWDAPSVVLVITAFFGGIALIIGAFFSGLAAMRAGRAADTVALTHTAVTAVAAKTDIIEMQGNSKATKDAAEIKSLQEKLGMVIETLDKAEKRAIDLAARAVPMQAVPEQLGRIEDNTATVAKVIQEALHATAEPSKS